MVNGDGHESDKKTLLFQGLWHEMPQIFGAILV